MKFQFLKYIFLIIIASQVTKEQKPKDNISITQELNNRPKQNQRNLYIFPLSPRPFSFPLLSSSSLSLSLSKPYPPFLSLLYLASPMSGLDPPSRIAPPAILRTASTNRHFPFQAACTTPTARLITSDNLDLPLPPSAQTVVSLAYFSVNFLIFFIAKLIIGVEVVCFYC